MNEVIKTVIKCSPNLFSDANYDPIEDKFNVKLSEFSHGNFALLKRDYGLLELIKPNVTTLDEKSKVLFTSGCKFSRSRFREWAKEKEISMVRTPTRADVIIVDKSSMESFSRMRPGKSGYEFLVGYLYSIKKSINIDVRYNTVSSHYRAYTLPADTEIYFEERFVGANPEYVELIGVHNLVRMPFISKSESNYVGELIKIASTVHTKKIIDVKDVERCIVKGQDIDLNTFQYICSLLDSNDPEINRVGMLQLNQLDLASKEFTATIILKLFWNKLVGWGQPYSVERTKLRRELQTSVLFTSVRNFVSANLHRVGASFNDIHPNDTPTEKNLRIFTVISKTLVALYRSDSKKIPLDEEKELVSHYYNLCREYIVKGIKDNTTMNGVSIHDFIRITSSAGPNISISVRELSDLSVIYPELEIPISAPSIPMFS